MADMTFRGPDDCDGEGERGESGERGKRGHRGHDGERGHDGHDGATGPTGPTGATGPTGSTGPTGQTGPSGGAGFTRQIFTANGVYIPTPGTSRVNVRMSGGGGAGAGAEGGLAGSSAGGGGAAGAALEFVVMGPITGGPVLIGAGETGSTGSGGSGLPTSVTINATVYEAAPGGGGVQTASTPIAVLAQGGITSDASTAVDIISGDNGMPGGTSSNHPLAGAMGGNGGSGLFGIGGRGAIGGGDGSAGSGFGSGGGGAATILTDQVGGDGMPGVVIIDEYAS